MMDDATLLIHTNETVFLFIAVKLLDKFLVMAKKISILLVEDEENLQEALKLNLELEGYEVTSAYDGAEALKAVQQEHFDLMILDVMLPELDGISVCENIRLQNN